MSAVTALLKSIEALTNSSLTRATPAGSTLKVLSSDEKIRHCRFVATQLVTPGIKSSPDFVKYLSYAVAALLRSHGDEDLSVWTVAEESLNLVIKVRVMSTCVATAYAWFVRTAAD
jgi:hypothetical protein